MTVDDIIRDLRLRAAAWRQDEIAALRVTNPEIALVCRRCAGVLESAAAEYEQDRQNWTHLCENCGSMTTRRRSGLCGPCHFAKAPMDQQPRRA